MGKSKPIFAKNVPLNPFYSTRIAGICIVITLSIKAIQTLVELVDKNNDIPDDIMGLLKTINTFAVAICAVVLGLFLVNFKV